MQEFVFEFEAAGVFYSRPKEGADWMRWKETPPRTVANHALAQPEFAAQLQAAKLQLIWTTQRKLADREAEGYQVLYELDRRNRVRRRLALYDGSFLLAKADATAAE